MSVLAILRTPFALIGYVVIFSRFVAFVVVVALSKLAALLGDVILTPFYGVYLVLCGRWPGMVLMRLRSKALRDFSDALDDARGDARDVTKFWSRGLRC